MKNHHYFPCQLTETGFDYRVGISAQNTPKLTRLFEENGICANGKNWGQLVKFLINLNAPNMSHVIDYEYDDFGLETSLRDKKDQIRLARIIHQSCKDKRNFQRILQKIKF